MLDLPTEADALISECGRYRYSLARRWGPGATCTFVMLNPSTADASIDDPTIRRCIGFARREGCGALSVVNVFAFRATKPADMMAADDPVGPLNDAVIGEALRVADAQGWPIIAAWGANEMAETRGRKMAATVVMQCLGKTKAGAPRHPLYVKGDAPLIAFP